MTARRIHYPGDVRAALAAGPQVMGPSLDGKVHLLESAEYDPETDRTTAHLKEVDQAAVTDMIEPWLTRAATHRNPTNRNPIGAESWLLRISKPRS